MFFDLASLLFLNKGRGQKYGEQYALGRMVTLNQHMNEAKFYYWQQKLRGFLPPKKGFVPVIFEKNQFLQSSASATTMPKRQPFSPNRSVNGMEAAGYEIVYPNGVSLKLNGSIDLQTLHSLLMLAR